MKQADSELGDRTRETVVPQAVQEAAALKAAREGTTAKASKPAKKTTKKAAARKR